MIEASPAAAQGVMPERQFAELVEDLRSSAAGRERLVDFLREDHDVYAQRGTAATVRMRGWLLLALAHTPLPAAALPFVLEELDTGRDAYLVAAAARALRACADPAPHFAPFLVQALANVRYHDDVVCFEGYGQYALSARGGTTATGELLQTLAWLGPVARGVLPDLDALAAGGEGLSRAALDAVARTAEAIRADPPAPEAAEGGCCADEAPLAGGFLWPPPLRRGCDSIASVLFEDQQGARITFGELFGGRPAVVVFFYTRCDNPLKCSLSIAKLARLQRMLAERGLGERVQTAAITYDPGFDLPARLDSYARNRGLRTDAGHRVLRAVDGIGPLRAHFELGVNFIESLVNRHRVELYILDAQGRIAASFQRIRWDEERVLDRVVTLLQEEPAPASPRPRRVGRLLSKTWSALAAIAPVGIAFFPKCPFCWAAYLSALGIAGAAQVPYMPWLWPVLAAVLVVNLGALWRRARTTGRWGGFALAGAGTLAILVLGAGFDVTYASACGVALTTAGSLLSARPRPLRDPAARAPLTRGIHRSLLSS